MKKEFKIRNKVIGEKDWWDKECTRGKRKVKRVLKRWRRGKESKKQYLRERKSWKELLENKQKAKRGGEEKELRELRNELEI